MRFRILIFSIATIFGCNTGTIVYDPALAPMESGQSRVETIACGHHAVGTNICWVNKDTDLKEVDVSIKTYFDGRIVLRALGANCYIDDSITYENSEPVNFSLGDYLNEIKNSCVLDILLQPEFPGEADSEIPIKGHMGRIVFGFSEQDIADLKGDGEGSGTENDSNIYKGAVIFNRRNHDDGESRPKNGLNAGVFKVVTGGSKKGKIRVQGCGATPFIHEYNSTEVSLSVRNILGDKVNGKKQCELYGRVVRLDMGNDLVFLVSVEIFDKTMVLLERPLVEVKKRRLFKSIVRFKSTGPVSWTFVNGRSVNDGSGKVRVDNPDYVVLRQITAAGRTKVLKINKGSVVWIR